VADKKAEAAEETNEVRPDEAGHGNFAGPKEQQPVDLPSGNLLHSY
jgi:hypothetical protein